MWKTDPHKERDLEKVKVKYFCISSYPIDKSWFKILATLHEVITAYGLVKWVTAM